MSLNKKTSFGSLSKAAGATGGFSIYFFSECYKIKLVIIIFNKK